MPTYEYRCENCGDSFEQLQPITAKALRKCPKCGKLKLVRLIGSGAGIIFKGSGFYQTDYRSENYTKSSKSEAPAKPAAEKATAEPEPKQASQEVKQTAVPKQDTAKKKAGGKED